MQPRRFLGPAEQQAVMAAIRDAELRTSGEVRVHLERRCKGGDAMTRARDVFHRLGMTATAARNGVLIYLAVGDRKFAVLGDEGIDQRVAPGFWEEVVASMEERFRAADFASGLVAGIQTIGERLAALFPPAGAADAADTNELPDSISSDPR